MSIGTKQVGPSQRSRRTVEARASGRGAMIIASAMLFLVSGNATNRSYAQPVEDAALYVIPPMDGKSLEGTVVEEVDMALDDMGKVPVDALRTTKQSEPLSPELEGRLDALSAERETMADAVATLDAPLLVPTLDDPDAPPRMDEGLRNPDRLLTAEDLGEKALEGLEPRPPQDATATRR